LDTISAAFRDPENAKLWTTELTRSCKQAENCPVIYKTEKKTLKNMARAARTLACEVTKHSIKYMKI